MGRQLIPRTPEPKEKSGGSRAEGVRLRKARRAFVKIAKIGSKSSIQM